MYGNIQYVTCIAYILHIYFKYLFTDNTTVRGFTNYCCSTYYFQVERIAYSQILEHAASMYDQLKVLVKCF